MLWLPGSAKLRVVKGGETIPPLSLHLNIALDAISQFCHPLANKEMGSYLFGSTLPDVHIISRATRRSTHFSDLNQEPADDGIAIFKQNYPGLSPDASLDTITRALVAGYFSHLITDRVWIQDIYRPMFGAGSELGMDPLSNIMDRALQYELDKRVRENHPLISRLSSLLSQFPPKSNFAFLDSNYIQQWHEFVMTAMAREPSWSNFPNYARRYLLPYGKVSQTELDGFLADLPHKLERILKIVTEERLAAFRKKATDLSSKAAREYLN